MLILRQTTTLPTNSRSASEVDDASDAEASHAISRRHINQDQARTRFEPSQVDARNVDFSDRLGSTHRSYRTSSRRRRRHSRGETEEIGEFSEDDEESIQVRLARLRRETEELRQLIDETQVNGNGEYVDKSTGQAKDGVNELTSILDDLSVSSKHAHTAEEKLLQSLSRKSGSQRANKPTGQAKIDDFISSSSGERSSLATTASLADRLAALEASLGTTAIPESSSTSAILPSLATLNSQINSLTTILLPSGPPLPSAPNVNLDELSTRIRTLMTDSERLTSSRKIAATAASELANARATAAAAGPGHADQLAAEHKVATATAAANANVSLSVLDDQTSKIRSLYQTLPTITSLHPILPTVLERLRSLSTVHAGAAQAADDLGELEKGQATLEDDLMKWRKGLERVEEMMTEGEGVLKGNVEVVGQRLTDLELRTKKLAR